MVRGLKTIGACGLAGLTMAGCLLKDTTETWYVDASGAVTWSVTEKDVRSDANAMPDRLQEESIYWLAVQQQRHPVAAGLQELGGANLRTRVIRGESPFTIVTDARFTGLDELGRRILAATGGMGDSSVTRNGATWEWKFLVRDPSSFGGVSEPSEGVSTLMNDMEALNVVLLAGRFESAEGFELSNDRRLATLVTSEAKATASHDQPEKLAIRLRLVWK